MNTPIYLDHAATTPPCPEAIAAFATACESGWGNPSSVHSFGRSARDILDTSRGQVATFFGCEPRNVVFTSSGTEADNLAIHGIIERWGPTYGMHVITSSIEHEAVLATVEDLKDRGIITLTIVDPEPDGRISPESIVAAMQDDTVLVSVMLANNEIGTIEDIPAIAAAVKDRNEHTFVHTDAVQGAGYIDCSLSLLGVDLFSVSSHKLYGPKGAGCLIVKDGVFIHPLLTGGGQERNRRSGTEAVPSLAAFGAALSALHASRNTNAARISKLKDQLIAGVQHEIPNVIVPGSSSHCLPSCASFIFPGIRNEQLLTKLDTLGICVSGGSACSAGTTQPSHVLKALGFNDDLARSLIRCTLGKSTTSSDITETIAAISSAVRDIEQSLSRLK